ncbi:MAG TPA: flagellar filament capping protein FliD [Terriglobales bacterium]|nr:flagellar filament capping protein FliD [Terriglobales bacterium]
MIAIGLLGIGALSLSSRATEVASGEQNLLWNLTQGDDPFQDAHFGATLGHAISDNGGITGLASIGVNMQDDGTLTVDDTKLSAVLGNHLSQVQNFFQSLKPAGFASNFAADLTQMTSSAGLIKSDLAQIAQQQKALADQISQLEDQLAVKQTRLIAQYSQVNAALQMFPMLMEQISGQLSVLSNNK